jgi:hypothetical protein
MYNKCKNLREVDYSAVAYNTVTTKIKMKSKQKKYDK